MLTSMVRSEHPKDLIIEEHNVRKSKFVQSYITGNSSKCQKSPVYLNYFKLNQIDNQIDDQINHHSNDQSNDQSNYQFNDQFNDQIHLNKSTIGNYICLRMVTLIVFFTVGFVFSTHCLDDQRKLNGVNSVHHSPDQLVAEKYSVNSNSTLFYDLALTNVNPIRKPIYFQFITNKSHHSSSLPRRPPHRAANNRPFNQIYLQKYILNNSTVKCNDGTNAGYYFRKGRNSKWIIFLEGGWFCYSIFTCHQRSVDLIVKK